MLSPRSSLWRLTAMMVVLIGVAMALVWFGTSWVWTRAFREAGRAVVLDDLGEYAALYDGGGPEAVRTLFAAGCHERDQILRVLSASGEVVLDMLLPGSPSLQWPDSLENAGNLSVDGVAWHQFTMPGGSELTVARRGLSDGAQLWFGRTNAADLEGIARIHDLILVAMVVAGLLAIIPILWFAGGVVRPVRRLIHRAHQLVGADSLIQRLENPSSIPELVELTAAFNLGLDRVQALTEELEAANDQLAHELRTPLARIRGNVEMVLVHSSHPRACEGAQRAIAEIERAARLIQSILAIRAGDSRTMKLQLEATELGDEVSTTCDLYGAAAEAKGLSLECRTPGEKARVAVDRQRIQQALCNLLDNALAYTPRGGHVEVALESDAGDVVVRVRDSGPGLRAGEEEQIWRRFMRGSAASARVPGIGLGLSVVRAIVNAHHGQTGACNRPEGGAEFWLRLPCDLDATEEGVGSGQVGDKL